jgi:hypothetical protein
MSRELIHRFVSMRRNHPAWLLLASRTGPLVLGSLRALIDAYPGGIDFEDATGHLADAFTDYANDSEFDFGDDHSIAARKELRQWIKRGLIVEREGELLATDALQRAFYFLDSLEDQGMTSTASRLATVQRAIEDLEVQLSDSQSGRVESLKTRIAGLEKELKSVQSGKFEVLDGHQAEEGIREVYQLAVSLRADFRRVEDSYREADRALRQRIVSENQNRGEIVDELLAGHAALVETVEGQVFESFHQQLVKSAELEGMKRRLRVILENENADRALQRKHKTDLRLLVSRLVQESERVIQARARSERDVRGFLKSGLADEQLRVGALLQEIFQAAFDVDWQSQKVRRSPGPLPPIAVSLRGLPLPERFLVKEVGDGGTDAIDLTLNDADPTEMDEEFWQAYRSLDRAKVFESTLTCLRESGTPLSIGALAGALPPTHDLETLAYWLAMAREAGIEMGDETESIDLFDEEDGWTRFFVPNVALAFDSVEHLDSENLE